MNNPLDWAREKADQFGNWAGEVWDDVSGKTQAEEAAAAIGEASAEDRAYAHPNVYGPLGSQTVTRNPDGTVSVKSSLADQQQALVDSLYGDMGTGRQSVEDALYQRATSRLDPQWGDRAAGFEAKLYNQGLRPGDEAYDKAMRDLEFARTDAYQAARNAATAEGGREQSRLISALMAAANPGLASYYGDNNATESAIAQSNILNSTPSGLDVILQLFGAAK